MPDQCGNCQHINKRNGNTYHDCELPHGFISEGYKNDRHPNVGIETVTALGKGSYLKVWNSCHLEEKKAGHIDDGYCRQNGQDKIPINRCRRYRGADFPEKHCWKKDEVDEFVRDIQEIIIGELKPFQDTSQSDKKKYGKNTVENDRHRSVSATSRDSSITGPVFVVMSLLLHAPFANIFF
jgi:hypothetical protein